MNAQTEMNRIANEIKSLRATYNESDEMWDAPNFLNAQPRIEELEQELKITFIKLQLELGMTVTIAQALA